MKRWLLILPLLLFAACKPENCNTPFGQGATIDMTDPRFSNIYNHAGGTVVVSCGHKGVIVRCVGVGEYAAFECACPKDHDVRMEPDSKNDAVMLTCGACGSRFEIINGAPLEGSATSCMLYQYNVAVEGTLLTIY